MTALHNSQSATLTAISATVNAVKAKLSGRKPKLGIILGSGLGPFADELANRVVIPFKDIPGFPQATVAGHSGALVIGDLVTAQGETLTIAALQGRLHYYEGHSMDAVALPARLLCGLGICALIVTNAAGGVNPSFREGDLMIIEDHINFTGQNPLNGPNIDELGPRFPDMSHAYDPALRNILIRAAEKNNVVPKTGIYMWLLGPTYETPAEIRAARTLGADAVGMSTVPEVIVARHMGVKVAGLSCITNLGAGLSTQKLTHEDVVKVAKLAVNKIFTVLKEALPLIAQQAEKNS